LNPPNCLRDAHPPPCYLSFYVFLPYYVSKILAGDLYCVSLTSNSGLLNLEPPYE
jgi:hypothetical protein